MLGSAISSFQHCWVSVQTSYYLLIPFYSFCLAILRVWCASALQSGASSQVYQYLCGIKVLLLSGSQLLLLRFFYCWESGHTKICLILILHSMLSCNCIKFSLVLNSFLSLKLFHFLQQGQSAYHCLSCNFMMSGRKKKICLEDHSIKQKKMNYIWRPIATNASSCDGLSIFSQDTLDIQLPVVPTIFLYDYGYDFYDFFCMTWHFGKYNITDELVTFIWSLYMG